VSGGLSASGVICHSLKAVSIDPWLDVRGSDDFGWNTHQPKKAKFGFSSFTGASSQHQLSTPVPFKNKFRPDFNLKDFSILYDYNYASMWTRWRRGYELYMYANQAYVGLNLLISLLDNRHCRYRRCVAWGVLHVSVHEPGHGHADGCCSA
jgi:hypothetical protein